MPTEAFSGHGRLAALVLAAGALVGTPPSMAGTNVTVISPEAIAFDAATLPVNVGLDLMLLRHRPTRKPSDAQLGACTGSESVLRILRDSGRVEVIYRGFRDVVCQPAGRLQFRSLEARHSFLLDSTTTNVPAARSFGLDLQADLRLLPAATDGAPPALALAWNGSWTGSVQLFSRWEALAVRTFNVVKTVPGITYERVEEDDDGFVNTGGTSDLGGLFRRKKKKDDANSPATPKAVKPTKAGKQTAAKAAAGPTAPPEREPSYYDEQQPAQVLLSGSWIGTGGGLILQRQALTGGAEAGDFYFLVTPSLGD